MAKVIGVSLIGGAYHNGRYSPGGGKVELDNDMVMHIAEAEAIGFQGCLNVAEQAGHDTKQFRRDLREWVKTGRFPNAKLS